MPAHKPRTGKPGEVPRQTEPETVHPPCISGARGLATPGLQQIFRQLISASKAAMWIDMVGGGPVDSWGLLGLDYRPGWT